MQVEGCDGQAWGFLRLLLQLPPPETSAPSTPSAHAKHHPAAGGLQYERFEMDYSYTFNPPGTDEPVGIDISQTAANKTRVLAGPSVTVAIFRLNADYAIGSADNVLTTAVGMRL